MAETSSLVEEVRSKNGNRSVLAKLAGLKVLEVPETSIRDHSFLLFRYAYSIWEENLFKCGNDEPAYSTIARLCYEVIKSPTVCKEQWFGGRCSRGGLLIRDDIAASLLICSAASQDQKMFTETLKIINDWYSSAKELVNCMIHNDEKCGSVALALFMLQPFSSELSLTDSSVFMMLLITKIMFKHQVLLEWIESEVVFVALLLKFLTCISTEDGLKRYKQTCDHLDKCSKDVESGSCKGYWIDDTEDPTTSEAINFTVQELAGDSLIRKEVNIPIVEQNRTWVSDEWIYPDDGLFSSLYDMLVRLRLKLIHVDELGLTKVSVRRFISLIEKFEDLVDE